MKNCHNISIRVFCRENETKERILLALKKIFPFDLEKEKINLNLQKAKAGDGTTDISIIEVELDKDRNINAFLKSLNKKLSTEQKLMLLRQENRIDEQCNYYIRLDKPKLLEGVYHITEGSNCFHLKLCIAAFPKTKQGCLVKVREIFKIGDD